VTQYKSRTATATTVITRSSAIAEGPCDALRQLKFCQLPCNSAETTFMTSPEQIKVMKLEGYSYSGPMCNKHVHLTMTQSSRFHCLIGVINKPTTDRVVDITCIPTTCCGEIFLVHTVEIAHVTLCLTVLVELRLVTDTDRHTDGHRPMASTADA